MSIDTDKFKKLYKELTEQLKVAFNSPRLYLAEYFDNLRADVDIEYEICCQKSKSTSVKEYNQRLEEYESIIKEIKTYEEECMTNFTSISKSESEEWKKFDATIKELECGLKSLQRNDILKFNVIQNIFDKTLLSVQRILFKNKSMIFLTSHDIKIIFELINVSNLKYSKLTLSKESLNFLLVIIKNTFVNSTFLDLNQQTFLKGKNGLDRMVFLEELSRLKEIRGSIVSLNLKTFESCTNDLKTLDLNEKLVISKGAQNLGPDLFKKMDQLVEISLSCNKLNLLDMHSFDGLSILKILDLSNNQIVRLETRNFSSLKNLTNLDLSSNNLSYITTGSFTGLDKLEILNLSSNKIDIIDLLAFFDLHSLIELNLANNRLQNLPGEVFRFLTKLKNLNLSENRLNGEELEACLFKGLICLEELSLSGNKFKFIESDLLKELFKDLIKLKCLNLSRTELSCLPSSALKSLKNLVKLDLFSSKEQLDKNNDFSLRGLNNLKNHHLVKNKITKMECGAFKDLKKLE